MEATWIRGRYTFSFTTTSAFWKAFSVESLSPVSQCQIWLSVFPSLSVRSTGASDCIDLNGSTTACIGSYSTSTASTASAAMYRSSAITAATSWDWYITVSVGSTIWVSDIRVGIQCKLYCLRTSPVITAWTPGMAMAASVLMLLILA